MGITREIANIITLGAVSKVDAAVESYERTVSKYEEYRTLDRTLGQDIKFFQNKLNDLKSELNRKKALITKIYSNPKTRERLSSIERKALQEYQTCANNLCSAPKFSAGPFVYREEWENSDVENLSIIIATTLIPIGGVIGAHASADEKIAEIQGKENEVLKAIEKIEPQALQMIKIKEKYKLALETLETVKSVVENFSNE